MKAAVSRGIDDGSFWKIEGHAVHLWTCRNEVPYGSEIQSLLSPAERERANAFHFDRDAQRYRVAHAFLRDVLSRYLRIDPLTIDFEINGFGKPLLNPSNELHFNLSHSGDVSICAIASGNSIGADVEEIRRLDDLHALANISFSPAERDRLNAYSGDNLLKAFFACWTRKEAYIKARGQGLSIPLDSFDVDLNPAAAPGDFGKVERGSTVTSWWWANIPVVPGYASAIVTEDSPADQVVLIDWPGPKSK